MEGGGLRLKAKDYVEVKGQRLGIENHEFHTPNSELITPN